MEETTKPKSKLKEVLLAILGAVVMLSLVFSLTSKYLPGCSQRKNTDISLNSDLMKVVSEYNKQAPFMIDANTQFDSMSLLPGNEVYYSFTTVNQTVDELDPEYIKEQQLKVLINQLKTNPQMESFRNHNVTVSFMYRDMNGVFICKVTATPDMYKE